MVSLVVGLEISDFVCRWFLPHVFKPSTQSRSTISLLPSCLTELCAYICVCMFSAPGYNNKKKSKIHFYILRLTEKFIKYTCCATPIEVFKVIGVLTVELYISLCHRSAKVAIALRIDWNNQWLCLCWLLALGLLKAKQTSGIRSQLSVTSFLNHWGSGAISHTHRSLTLWFGIASWRVIYACPLLWEEYNFDKPSSG